MDSIDVPISNLFSLAANQVMCRVVNKLADGDNADSKVSWDELIDKVKKADNETVDPKGIKKTDLEISINDLVNIMYHIDNRYQTFFTENPYKYHLLEFEEIIDYCNPNIINKERSDTRGIVFRLQEGFFRSLREIDYEAAGDRDISVMDDFKDCTDRVFNASQIEETEDYKLGVANSMEAYLQYGPDQNESFVQ